MINGIDIVVTRLAADPATVRAAAALLSDSERERAAGYTFDRDRQRFVVGRARLRELIGARLALSPRAVEIVYGAQGKPAIAPNPGGTDLRFNISHCDDVAVYAFSSGRELGVDVEAVRALPDADDIAGRFFSRREHDTYRGLAAADRPRAFFDCWTRKEAFIKALGDGLSYPLDRFDVSLAPGEPARILRVADVAGDRCGWSIRSFSPAPGFVAAIVAQTPG